MQHAARRQSATRLTIEWFECTKTKRSSQCRSRSVSESDGWRAGRGGVVRCSARRRRLYYHRVESTMASVSTRILRYNCNDDDDDEHGADAAEDDHHLHVLPPKLAFELPG
jgi:hypothetical protein